MLLALLLAAATPSVEQERISDNLHRLALPAAGIATVAEGQAALLAEARDACGPSLPAFGSFTLDGERIEQELLCLPPGEPGDDRLAVLAGSYAWLAAKDGGRYEEAWALLSDRMKGASPLAQWRAAAERFNDRAGPVRGRQVTRISFYRDPPDAPEPGLYAAADFSADFANFDFVCGYLMWRLGPDGLWRLVREEQNLVDKQAAEDVTKIDRPRLREQMGCRD